MFSDLSRYERGVYSQGGEDGVLRHLFDELGEGGRHFVEFGAKDGREHSNTANLRLHHGWSGLLLDAGADPDDPLVRPAMVTAENVNALFADHGVPERIDLLSIDIDGNDYWVWKALTDFVARVVVVEYNLFFGLEDRRTITYDADHVWRKGTHYHGASLAALRDLGHQKGYALVHTDGYVPNAFFVHRSELPADFEERPIEQLTPWVGFDEPPDATGMAWMRV